MNTLSSLFIFLSLLYVDCAVSNLRKLVVVSFDGFRYDYLDRSITPTLNALKRTGTDGKFIINVFPTQTFTNHFTIATGLYPEIHGVLGSSMYDVKRKELLNYGSTLFHFNDKVLPIWTLNEKTGRGRHSGVMMWPGSEFEYGRTNATFVQAYNPKMAWERRVDTVVGWLKHQTKPANLVMMYFEEPDEHSHIFGPNSGQTNNQIKRVDAITKYLVDSLRNSGLLDVNLVFFSDHGMDGVQKKDIIDLTKIVGNLADMYGTSPVLQVYPKPGTNVENVFQILNKAANSMKTFKIYKKDTIPEHFHYKKCERAPPILAVAEPKYAFQDLYKMIEIYKKEYNISDTGFFGVHGYDPSYINMHPFFVADGPIFKNNYTVKGKMENIDMYLLFMHVLNLEMPFVKPNGTFNRVSEIFVSDKLPTTFITGCTGLSKCGEDEPCLIVLKDMPKNFSPVLTVLNGVSYSAKVLCVIGGMNALILLLMLIRPFCGCCNKNKSSVNCITRRYQRESENETDLIEKQELLLNAEIEDVSIPSSTK